jgi:RimJ/RimL family protein N-acetyltransferase
MNKKKVAFICVHNSCRSQIAEIYGICLAENKASVAVMEKCGFTNVYSGMGLYQGADRDIIKNVWKM